MVLAGSFTAKAWLESQSIFRRGVQQNARSAAEVAAYGVLEGDRAIFWGQYNYVFVAISCIACAFLAL